MKRRVVLVVSVVVLAAMPVPSLNLGYVQAQTPGQIPMFDPLGNPGVCNVDLGVECVDSNITQDPFGRVFIGRTSPITGAEVFGVRGTAGPNTFTGMYIDGTDISSLPFYGYSTNGTARAWHYFDWASGQWRLNNGGDRVAVLNNGNVGIGTTTPTGKLHVTGSNWATSPVVFSSSSGSVVGATLDLDSTPGTGGRRYSIISTASSASAPAGSLGIYDNAANAFRFVITQNGNVGIGTTNPADVKLRVAAAPSVGVHATAANTAVIGESSLAYGVSGVTQTPNYAGVYARSANGSSTNLGLYVDGTFQATGTKNAVVPLDDGQHVLLTAEESTEVWFSDYGTARLVHGRAVVQIDRVFLQTVDTAKDYHVFLTARGNPLGSLYIDHETPSSFEIRETTGTANIKVSYRIVAKRKNFANERLKRVTSPYAYAEPQRQSATWARDGGGTKLKAEGKAQPQSSDARPAPSP